MFREMRELALYFVAERLECLANRQSEIEAWFHQIHEQGDPRLFPYLVEENEKIEYAYILSPDAEDPDLAILSLQEIGQNYHHYPFNKPTGSQSAQIGPVIKRNKPSGKDASPGKKIRDTTLKAFGSLASGASRWSDYFSDILSTLDRKKLRFGDQFLSATEEKSLFDLAIENIDLNNQTVFFAVRDSSGRLPGEVEAYREYLMDFLPRSKYTTNDAPARQGCRCNLCGKENTTVFTNAFKGAGLNVLNVDRPGAFPSLSKEEAWKAFSLCGCCADLLYIYKNYVKDDYTAVVAGTKALIIPRLVGKACDKKLLQRRLLTAVESLPQEGKEKPPSQGDHYLKEQRLLNFLSKEQVIGSFDYLWAVFGQNIEKISGLLTDILPSRMAYLSKQNAEIRREENKAVGSTAWSHPIFPIHSRGLWPYDLSMSLLRELFYRPGGKATQKKNESAQLNQFRRDLLGALLHKRSLSPQRFWQEWQITAEVRFSRTKGHKTFLEEIYIPEKEPNSPSSKKENKKPKEATNPQVSFAGWMRHIAMFLHYLREEGVYSMGSFRYVPKEQSLQPFFTEESGIDSKEKAFAFLLGVLFGKLVEVQAARKVNVAANALTWLKRLSLHGKDLPELYNKIHGKLLEYKTFGNAQVRAVSEEISSLGVSLGTQIALDRTQACYFLLLGKALSKSIFVKAEKEENAAVSNESA